MKTFQAFLSALLIVVSTTVGALAYDGHQFPGKGSKNSYLQSIPVANMGAKFLGQGKFAEAIKYYDKAIAIYSFDASMQSNRGMAFSGLGKHSEAIACFKKGILLEPSWSVSYNNLADELRKTRDYQGAESNAKSAIQLAPSDPIPLLTLAETYIDMNKFDKAHALIDKVNRMPQANDQFIKETIKAYNERMARAR